jgi:hypothetical protein
LKRILYFTTQATSKTADEGLDDDDMDMDERSPNGTTGYNSYDGSYNDDSFVFDDMEDL